MKRNFLLMSDSYKYSHSKLYPPGTTNLYSYLESRGGKYNSTVFFGLQFLVKEYLEGKVFDQADVEEAESFICKHGEPFNRAAWQSLLDKHGGTLPLRIRAVKEGTEVPVKNVLLDCEVTDPEFYWLSSWVETVLCRLWYAITCSTQSHEIKKSILHYLESTSDDPKAEINFKLHDFGARGVSSSESAGIGGMAHLVNFMGSDTVEGIRYAQHYYGVESGMPAFSIPATEHSTITSWGRENEEDAYRNVVKQFAKPGALFACVSDSYDLYNAIEKYWCGSLREEIEKSGATLVVRPDSGNPPEVVLKTIQLIDKCVGSELNTKGYRVLPKWIRVIQGDGINHDSIVEILNTLYNAGYSASNVAFGMGGALLQQINRDTQKFAYKCSEATIEGVAVPVYKDPITDPGKRSKSGRLALVEVGGDIVTIPEHKLDESTPNMLELVFENGDLKRHQTLDNVREIANSYL